ncbi:3-ketosteroid-9-alpha-hydroxylase [Streptomyces sp. Ru73]|uniref:ferredoxin--NADP reductase n=1 Tax=Streptomyces sp. Ru73 TaxID=2080748 RepID=UPI000CDCFDD7|nr:ferredoxin--NADP reductase [Streptomyces sp. Ru73]POX42214.1 3-ketosteroid-9-alpha-hydroxylase [Streptomyces sp. Ru73]
MPEPRTYRLCVTAVVEETADARSFVLRPRPEDAGRFAHRPGQFLTVRVPGAGVARCYSLASSPHTVEPLKITVKRVAGGYGSHWLCDRVATGDELEVLPPAGTFTPASLDRDLLLVAGGSGITPVISIAKSVLVGGTGKVALLYANRDESAVIFRDELRELTEGFPDRLVAVHWLESVQGLPAADRLAGVVAPYADRDTYVCGPGPLMDAVEAALGGGRVHRERFFSLSADVFAAPGDAPGDETAQGETVQDEAGEGHSTAEVELDGQTHVVRWPVRTPLLDALLADGVDAPYSCREGSCGACACRIVSGETKMFRNDVLDEQDLAEGYVLACQAVPLTNEVAVSYS